MNAELDQFMDIFKLPSVSSQAAQKLAMAISLQQSQHP